MTNPVIAFDSDLWAYLSPEQKKLASDGQLLIEDCDQHPNEKLSDYSYLVFPFAKLYEGFLKQLLRDLNIITFQDYRSDHFRIGEVLSPNLVGMLGDRSAYRLVRERYGVDLADDFWRTWKEGRNLVFHYFPHNYRALTHDEAIGFIHMIEDTMKRAVEETKVNSLIENTGARQ